MVNDPLRLGEIVGFLLSRLSWYDFVHVVSTWVTVLYTSFLRVNPLPCKDLSRTKIHGTGIRGSPFLGVLTNISLQKKLHISYIIRIIVSHILVLNIYLYMLMCNLFKFHYTICWFPLLFRYIVPLYIIFNLP